MGHTFAIISLTPSSLLNFPPNIPIYPTSIGTPRVCPWTLIIDAHNIFSSSPSIFLLKQASFAVSFLTFFSLSCLILFQTLTGCADFGSLLFFPNPSPDFLLCKYTEISEKMQSDIRWSQRLSSLWYTVFKIVGGKKRNTTKKPVILLMVTKRIKCNC